jgi:hypothetical protein
MQQGLRMNSTTSQASFSDDIISRLDEQTQSLMRVFEQQVVHLTAAIEQQSNHYSMVPHEDIRGQRNQLVAAILASTSAKYVSLSQTIIDSVNKHDFLAYSLAARSMIEIVATLRYFVLEKISTIIHEMAQGQYAAAQVKRLIVEENKYFRGTRFDWVDNGFCSLIDRQAGWAKEKKEWEKGGKKGAEPKKWNPNRSPLVEQVNVTTCLSKWSNDEPGVATALGEPSRQGRAFQVQ